MTNRRQINIISTTFLDLILNFSGACIILMLVAMTNAQKKPCPQIALEANVCFDRQNKMLWDTLNAPAFANLKVGDKIIVTVAEYKALNLGNNDAMATTFDCSQCPQRQFDRCTLPHFPPNCPDKGECLIAASVTGVKCNNNNTTDRSTDDTYSFYVNFKELGECATSWKDQNGRIGQYNSSALYGPFLISGGKTVLDFKDLTKPDGRAHIEVEPPLTCSTTPGAVATNNPQYPGLLNFVVLFDEDKGTKVSLSVEKGRKKCYHRHNNEKSIGQWGNDKIRIYPPPPKTGIQYVRQYGEYIEGDYEIYGTCKESNSNSGQATLHILSKDKSATNITQVFPALAKDQKTLLMKVHISQDGSIRRTN